MDDAQTQPPARRGAGACPWCGSGTPLELRGDGFGATHLCCTACGCKGPPTPIGDDFATSDAAAIDRWSRRPIPRPRIAGEVLDRVQDSIDLHSIMAGGAGATHVSVRLADLVQLLGVVTRGRPEA